MRSPCITLALPVLAILTQPVATATAQPGPEATAPAPVRSLRIACAQIPVTNNITVNLATLDRALQFAIHEKADVLVTPEGSLSGYTHRFDAEATDRAMEAFAGKARAAGIGLVVGTCFTEPDGKRYDAQRFYAPSGDYLGFHAKILLCRHMTEPGRKGEVDYFQSAPLRTFDLAGTRVGGLVCNDMWANPEYTPMPDPHLAQQLAGLGARIIFLSVNSGFEQGPDLELHRAFHESNLRIRARAAGVWVAVANAADPAGAKEVNCRSGILDPDGHWIAQAPAVGEQFLALTVRLPAIAERR
jgi:predicted amidohydrolase